MAMTRLHSVSAPPAWGLAAAWPAWAQQIALALTALLTLAAPLRADGPVVSEPAGQPMATPTPTPPAALAAAPGAPTIDRLPPGMTVRPTPTELELLMPETPGGPPVRVGSVPTLGAPFATVYVSGYLYIARGRAPIVVMDTTNPMQPRYAGIVDPAGAVSALWGGNRALVVQRLDGATLLYDLSDPAQPRYQSLLAAPTTPVAQSTDAEHPQPQRPSTEHAYQSRVRIAAHPFLYFANGSRTPTSGGVNFDLAYQFIKPGGLWWGIEFAPLQINSYYNGSPTMNTRAYFGYSWRRFALGAAVGSGYSVLYPLFQIGPVFRFGRIDGVHSTLRLQWSLLQAFSYPVAGQLTLEIPISQRLGLRYELTGDSALYGFYTTLGLQQYVGGDHRWKTTAVTTGVGFTYMQSTAGGFTPTFTTNHPGLIFTLAVEPRF
jgi:hypothetical protein